MSGATTIDEVIARLDEILAQAERERSRLGYFPALYRKVTVAVKRAIAAGEFDDGPRMERLDVHFANRYLDAFDRHRQGLEATRSWAVTFSAGQDWCPIVLQHLLLGINAHINLDLGIAAARTCPGAQLDGLEGDFNKINELLASLVDEVKAELTEIWAPLGPLDRISGNIEDVCVNFSMAIARDGAWAFAKRLAEHDEVGQEQLITKRDQRIGELGHDLWKPPIGRLALLLIRLGERRSVARNIEILR